MQHIQGPDNYFSGILKWFKAIFLLLHFPFAAKAESLFLLGKYLNNINYLENPLMIYYCRRSLKFY